MMFEDVWRSWFYIVSVCITTYSLVSHIENKPWKEINRIDDIHLLFGCAGKTFKSYDFKFMYVSRTLEADMKQTAQDRGS